MTFPADLGVVAGLAYRPYQALLPSAWQPFDGQLPPGAGEPIMCVTIGHEDEYAVGRAWMWEDEQTEVHGDYCEECMTTFERGGDRVEWWNGKPETSGVSSATEGAR